ncbi:Uncharacterized protein dnm_022590 [Desulfonema magnum]|uniref:Uncharacterized protein n=1 Tax=Desulfonema magnum TaxID=45655 RepID=A0A975BJ09_9BACT|nr:Uncharacterized protein dnm_022590 [Desulfonema magnum]
MKTTYRPEKKYFRKIEAGFFTIARFLRIFFKKIITFP